MTSDTVDSDLKTLLSRGDMRTVGASPAVVRSVLTRPAGLSDLVVCLTDDQAGVRMRSADALEKISAENAALLQPFTDKLITIAGLSHQQEVQWHMAQIFSRLILSPRQQELVVNILVQYIKSTKSSIVRVFSLQALSDIAAGNGSYRDLAVGLIKAEVSQGTPAVISRGKKLLASLKS